MREVVVKVHSIAEDGLPDMDELTGRVLFIFDGNVTTGWPLHVDPEDSSTAYSGLWEGNSDVSHGRPFSGVTHWIELPVPEWELHK